MTKKAGAVSEETRRRLMDSGRREFLEKGFLSSSLRHICSQAGVTTGALYFFFRDKDDLFTSIIDEVTDPFLSFIEKHYETENDPEETEEEGSREDVDATLSMLDFYYEKRDTWQVLLRHRDHRAVKNFFSEFTRISVKHYRDIVTMTEKERGESLDVDDFSLYQFVHMQLDLMLTLTERDDDRAEMMRLATVQTKMLRGAFRVLLREEKK